MRTFYRALVILVVAIFATTAQAKVYHESELTRWYVDDRAKVIKTTVYETDTRKKAFAFRLEGFIGKMEKYETLITTLNQASAGTNVYIYFVNNNGGYVSTATKVIEAINNSKADVVVVVQGRALSAAANITCAADRIYMTGGSVLGFHLSQYLPEKKTDVLLMNAFYTVSSAKNKIYWQTECVTKGLMSQEDVDRAMKYGELHGADEEKPFVYISDDVVRNRIPDLYREGGFE